MRTKAQARSETSVIVPALNAAHLLPRCLAALATCMPSPDCIFVVDDGSGDATAEVARLAGATVLRNEGEPDGPGLARNRAARIAASQLLLFVDADVVVHPDALALLKSAFDDPDVVAAFGSYDDAPPAPGIVSRYANLRHHYMHQRSPHRANTFWAGLGMVRRTAFLAAGGFSSSYGQPSIEDIELGSRLIARGGTIAVVPSAQGTHLKRWTLVQLWRTDIFQRAIPWAHLIAEKRSSGAGLNGAPRERVAATLANITAVAMLGTALHPQLLALAIVAGLGYVVACAPFLRFLAHRMQLIELIAATFLHFVYHLYASQVFGWVVLWQRLRALTRKLR